MAVLLLTHFRVTSACLFLAANCRSCPTPPLHSTPLHSTLPHLCQCSLSHTHSHPNNHLHVQLHFDCTLLSDCRLSAVTLFLPTPSALFQPPPARIRRQLFITTLVLPSLTSTCVVPFHQPLSTAALASLHITSRWPVPSANTAAGV